MRRHIELELGGARAFPVFILVDGGSESTNLHVGYDTASMSDTFASFGV